MINSIEGLNHLRRTDPQKAMSTAGKEFESIFAYQILKTMGDSMSEGLFGSGLASDFYKDMLFQSVARNVAESGALGIGKIIEGHVEKLIGDEGLSSKQEYIR
ncbi:MAG: rod-binding protein [Deltaproteobacteria bacterium]|nr:rod-binding protein [Deltaproteobacteria bacterium]